MLLRYLASMPTAAASAVGEVEAKEKSELEQDQVKELSPVSPSASKNADTGTVLREWNEAIVGFIERQLKLFPEVFNSATQHGEQLSNESPESSGRNEKPLWQDQAAMSLATLHVLGGYVEDIRQGGIVRVLPGSNPRTTSRLAGILASVTSMPHHSEAAYLSSLLPVHLQHHQKKSETDDVSWETDGYEGQQSSQSDQEPCDIQHMCALDELPSTQLLCRHISTLLPIFQVAIQSQVAVIQALQLIKEEQEDQSIPDSDAKIETPSNPSLFLSSSACCLRSWLLYARYQRRLLTCYQLMSCRLFYSLNPCHYSPSGLFVHSDHRRRFGFATTRAKLYSVFGTSSCPHSLNHRFSNLGCSCTG